MDNKEEHNNILREQFDLVEKISGIMDKQISDIDDMDEKEGLSDEIEEIKRTVTLLIKKFYLILFNEIIKFLLAKLKVETNDNFRFYIPNIRTILEIYAQLLYLSSQEESKQAAICIANQLFTFSKIAKGSAVSKNEQEKENYQKSKETYNGIYLEYKPFLDKEKIDIPADMEKFTQKKLIELSLKFPTSDQMLKEKSIKSFSPETVKVFNEVPKRIYDTYRYFSDYIHGRVFLVPIVYGHGNERFWIISKIQILSSLITELINVKVLDNKREIEFENWLKELDKTKENFLKFWQEYNKHN